jgi:hypothetical protein
MGSKRHCGPARIGGPAYHDLATEWPKAWPVVVVPAWSMWPMCIWAGPCGRGDTAWAWTTAWRHTHGSRHNVANGKLSVAHIRACLHDAIRRATMHAPDKVDGMTTKKSGTSTWVADLTGLR